MKKRMICCTLVLLICMSLGGTAYAKLTRTAEGNSNIESRGRNVTLSGYSDSDKYESEISVTVRLMELRGGQWYEIARVSNSASNADYVSASSTAQVSGGCYYKVMGTHVSRTGNNTYYKYTETGSQWIP